MSDRFSFGGVYAVCYTGKPYRRDALLAELSRVGVGDVHTVWSFPTPYKPFLLSHIPHIPDLERVPGAWGATLGHYEALKIAYELGQDNVLFVEDDCRFLRDVDAVYRGLASAPAGWDVLMLDHFVPRRTVGEVFDGWLRTGQVWSTACYVVRRRIMPRLIDMYESPVSGKYSRPVMQSSDHWIDTQHIGVDAAVYCAVPNLAIQRDCGDVSNYDASHGGRHVQDGIYRRLRIDTSAYAPFLPDGVRLHAAASQVAAASKRYGVLYRPMVSTGLFSYFIKFCGGIKYCEDHGLVPVIDMKNHDNFYRQSPGVNSWEYFFEQPCGVSVDDIAGRDAVQVNVNPIGDFPYYDLLSADVDAGYWRGIVRRYMRIRHGGLAKYANPRLEEALSGGRVLGVLARGTDYVNARPRGHPVQPAVQTMVDDVRRAVRDEHFDAVYLATEDTDVQRAFVDGLGNELVIPSMQDKISAIPERRWLFDYSGVRRNVDFGAAYLKAIYDLSRCHGILAGRTSGTIGARLMSDGYEYERYYDLGLYP